MSGIDLHTHLAPAIDLERHRLSGVARGDDGRLTVDGRPLGPPPLYSPERLDAYRVATGLDEAVVSVPPPFFRQDQEAAPAEAWTQALNAGLRAAVAAHPALTPLAYLPLEHPEVALREYHRIREERGWAGVVGAAGGRSASLAGDGLAPLWDALHEDGRLLLLHPGTSPDARLDDFYLSNLLGNPVETAVAAAQLVFGDVLASRPDMRVLLVHCGGCVPGVVGRWERGARTERPGIAPLTESPRVAVRRLYVDCLAHDETVVDQAVLTFGEDKVVLGSDWPFPMGVEDPRTLVSHRGPAFAAAVATGNALAALGR